MKRDDLMWLAGLLEGEGSFGFYKPKFAPRIQITMADKDVMERVALLFGGKNLYERPSPRSNWNPVYQCAVQGDAALEIMSSIYPVMGKRRQKRIRECIEAGSRRKGKSMGEHRPASKLKAAYIPLIRHLAKRGFVQRKIARMCNVSPSTIHSILKAKAWNHV